MTAEIQAPSEPGSPVCLGSLLMKQDFVLGGGDRVGVAGEVVPGVSCLSVQEEALSVGAGCPGRAGVGAE